MATLCVLSLQMKLPCTYNLAELFVHLIQLILRILFLTSRDNRPHQSSLPHMVHFTFMATSLLAPHSHLNLSFSQDFPFQIAIRQSSTLIALRRDNIHNIPLAALLRESHRRIPQFYHLQLLCQTGVSQQALICGTLN